MKKITIELTDEELVLMTTDISAMVRNIKRIRGEESFEESTYKKLLDALIKA